MEGVDSLPYVPGVCVLVETDKLQRLLRALDSMEWAGGDWGDETMMFCPFCENQCKRTRHGNVRGPHATDCEWAALQEMFRDVPR